jgi:hypothetical protein
MKFILALCIGFAALTVEAAAEADSMTVSATVLPSCTVTTDGAARVSCAGEDTAGEGETRAEAQAASLAAADVDVVQAPSGTTVVVTY